MRWTRIGSVGSKAHNHCNLTLNMPTKTPAHIPIEPAALRNEPQVQALISFLEHEAHPMIVLDPDYKILAANTAYQRQFGTVDKPYIGHKCFRISHHYDVPCDQAGRALPDAKGLRDEGPGPGAPHPSHAARARNTWMWNCAPSLMRSARWWPTWSGCPRYAAPRPDPVPMVWSGEHLPSTPRCRQCSAWRRPCCRCCCWANRGTGKELFSACGARGQPTCERDPSSWSIARG